MDEACLFSNLLRKFCQEGDDVMSGFCLYFVDTRNSFGCVGQVAFYPNCFGSLLGYYI